MATTQDPNNIEDSSSLSHTEVEEEIVFYLQEDTKQASTKNGLTLACHHAVHVMSHNVPHHLWIM